MRKRMDLTGERYGKLLARKRAADPHFWICACDCGKVLEVRQYRLRGGLTKSCGCEPKPKVTRTGPAKNLKKHRNRTKQFLPWTDADNELLSTSAETPRVLAFLLKRSKGEVEKQMRILGLWHPRTKRISIRPESKHTHL